MPNQWLIALGDELDEPAVPVVLVPLGLIATRLLPLSNRPMAQFVALWLAYAVLPVLARSHGPNTWKGLDDLLNPVD